MEELSGKRCKPCEGGVFKMNQEQIDEQLKQLPQWQFQTDHIERDFKFKNYYSTIAFVNAVAWFTHHENHHPDLEVGYNHCKVKYSTHAINGLSENDFICAAKVDNLFEA